MSNLTFLAEGTKSTSLVGPSATAAVLQGYVRPTAGSLGVTIRTVVKKADATNVVLTLKTADNATGTNATNATFKTPLFTDGVREDNAFNKTIGSETGTFIIDFCVDPGLIPEGKFIGVHCAASHTGNIISVTAVDNSSMRPGA